MVGLGIFDRRVGQTAAPVAALHRALAQAGQIGQDLRPRIAGVRVAGGIEAGPELGVVVAQIRGRQFVLGRKAAVQAGLGHPRFVDDGVHPHGADAIPVEHFPRGLADAVGRQRRFGGGCLAGHA
ncbi:hypothetical protein D9M69_651130 [compost metagenome]